MSARIGVFLAVVACCAIHFVHEGLSLIFWILFTVLSLMFLFKSSITLLLALLTYLCFGLISLVENKAIEAFTEGDTIFSFSFVRPLEVDDGVLTSVVKAENGERLLLRYEPQSEKDLVRLTEKISTNVRCQAEGMIEKPRPPTNFNAFHYETYLHSNDVFWIFTPNSLTLTSCQYEPPLLSFSFIHSLRETFLEKINAALPSPTRELTIALVFGIRVNLGDDVTEAYEKLGLVHILAISGLNIGLLSVLCFRILIRIGWTREAAYSLLLIGLPLYAILSGGSPSVVRAVLMAVVAIVCFLIRHPKSLQLAFFTTFFLVLIFQPFLIYAVSFQLSYAVSFALILSLPSIVSRQSGVVQLIVVSFMAQVASLPFLLFHFYTFSPISLPLNMVVVPLYSFILLPYCWILAFLAVTVSWVPSFAAGVSNELISFTHSFAIYMSGFPFSSLTIGKPMMIELIILILGNLAIGYLLEKGGKQSIKQCLLICSVVILAFLSPKLEGEVTMIDVGQGDSIVIQLPLNQGTYVIDAPGPPQWGNEEEDSPYSPTESMLLPYLKSLGIQTIDKLIITHGDSDHAGGASVLLDEFSVEEVVLGMKETYKDIEKELVKQAEKKNTVVTLVREGHQWSAGKNYFQVVSAIGTGIDANESSIVLRALIGETTFLFTSDIGEETETSLIRSGVPLEADVLKVAHHGSQTSSSVAFLEKVKPSVALISAGRNNLYGHPHQEVLERLKKFKIRVFITSQNGAIKYSVPLSSSGTFRTVLP